MPWSCSRRVRPAMRWQLRFGASSSWTLTALPLFVWMGEILFRTRLSQDMFQGLAPLGGTLGPSAAYQRDRLCHLRRCVGLLAATCATIGKMTLPELKSRGYPDDMVIGTLSGSGTLGLLIPVHHHDRLWRGGRCVNFQAVHCRRDSGIVLATLFSGYITV